MALYTMPLLIFLILFNSANSDRIRDKMYRDLGGVFCFTRLTATEQYGCSSSLNGNTGVVHMVDSKKDIDWLLSDGAAAAPYVPVVPLIRFNRPSMENLRDSGKISGMILYSNGSLSAFSNEDTCPNRKSGLPSEQCGPSDAWNPIGSSLLLVKWGFPIAYVQNLSVVDDLRNCFLQHNAELEGQVERSLCAVQLRSHMVAAVDTRTCLRRNNLGSLVVNPVRYCDPLGDNSIYQMMRPTAVNPKKSVILLIARQDGASLFDNLTPGAMSPITSIVTVLAVAKYLKDMGAYEKVTDKNLMILLLNGEAFDYIGSSRVVYDIGEKTFPSKNMSLTMDQIGLILELDQMYGDNFFYHTHSGDSANITNVVENLNKELNAQNISLDLSPKKLPPSSLQIFLKTDPSVDHILLTNYNSSYLNPFYHSIKDDASFLNYTFANGSNTFGDVQNKISKVALAVAKSLYANLFNEQYATDLPLNEPLVDELLHCYLETQNCSLFFNVTNGAELRDSPSGVYVGVYGHDNDVTHLTKLTLSYLTGNIASDANNSSLCENKSATGFNYVWIDGKCIGSSSSLYPAYSPAFDIEGYNWTSNRYSSWTESIWRDLSMRMFLKPSWKHEVFSLSMGLLVLVISFVVVYFVRSKADIMFNRVVLRGGGGW